MKIVHVQASTSYDVCIGTGLLQQAGTHIKNKISPCKVAIITDTNVAPLYANIVSESLTNEGFDVCVYAFPAGEQSKRLSILGNVLEYLAQQQFTRSDLIVALGGGVVGDLAGFAAAVYQRGIRFVQIPTTVLSAVDSSVGGKTAVDLEAGKNLAGAFYQPQLVLCDTNTLRTLTPEFFADGVAEIIKYGVLGNKELLQQVYNGDFLNDDTKLSEIIETCVKMKRDIVQQDEFDTGKRQLLNLGHTFGHAIEQKSNFTLTHGHAVAIGLHLIARAAEQKNIALKGTAKQIEIVLQNNHLPTETTFTAKELAAGALIDKKRRGSSIQFVFPTKIGACQIIEVPISEVEQLAVLSLTKEVNEL